jgi:hypothetical protein
MTQAQPTCSSCRALRQSLTALPPGTIIRCPRCGQRFKARGARSGPTAAPAARPVPALVPPPLPPVPDAPASHSPAPPQPQSMVPFALAVGGAALVLVLALVGVALHFANKPKPGAGREEASLPAGSEKPGPAHAQAGRQGADVPPAPPKPTPPPASEPLPTISIDDPPAPPKAAPPPAREPNPSESYVEIQKKYAAERERRAQVLVPSSGPGDPALTQGMADLDAKSVELVFDLTFTDEQRRQLRRLLIEEWKGMTQAKKQERARNLKTWEKLPTMRNYERNLQRALIQSRLLALFRQPDASERMRWLVALYERALRHPWTRRSSAGWGGVWAAASRRAHPSTSGAR